MIAVTGQFSPVDRLLFCHFDAGGALSRAAWPAFRDRLPRLASCLILPCRPRLHARITWPWRLRVTAW